MPIRYRLFASLLGLASACCSGSSGAVDSGAAPAIELGTGDIDFVPIADGDTLFVIQGPQGGFHVLGSVQVDGIDAGDPDDLGNARNPTTTFRVFDGASRVDLMASSYTQGLDAAPGGGYQMLGRLVLLDITDDAQLDGTELRIEVEVVDANRVQLQDQRTVTARPHPANR